MIFGLKNNLDIINICYNSSIMIKVTGISIQMADLAFADQFWLKFIYLILILANILYQMIYYHVFINPII